MSRFQKAYINRPENALKKFPFLEELLEHVELNGVDSALEIGCGPGYMSEALHDRYEIHVQGTDLDPDEVALASGRTGDRPGLGFIVADAAALPFRDGEFDLVFSQMVLHHMSNWEDALSEVARVLRPGGYYLFHDLTYSRLLKLLMRPVVRSHSFYDLCEIESSLRSLGFLKLYERQPHSYWFRQFTEYNVVYRKGRTAAPGGSDSIKEAGLLGRLKQYGPRRAMQFALKGLKYYIVFRMTRRSYSQRGEDIIADRLLGRERNGFYVDIGAGDPRRFNNTKRFYNRGWHGINIEPEPGVFRRLESARSRDVNLNIGIGSTTGTATFCRMVPSALSTFERGNIEMRGKQGFRVLEEVQVEIRRLEDVLEEYRPSGEIDLMSIDVEGFELEVLAGNRWDKFKPRVIIIESGSNYEDGVPENHQECESLLLDVGYEKILDNGLNSIYISR